MEPDYFGDFKSFARVRELAAKHNLKCSRSLENFEKRVAAEYNNPNKDKKSFDATSYKIGRIYYYKQYRGAIAYFKAMRELYLEGIKPGASGEENFVELGEDCDEI